MMKRNAQEQEIISMMRRPIPKKRVGIVTLKMFREREALYGTDRFQKAEEAVSMVRPLFDHADREMLVVLSLDTALTPLAMEIVAVGSINVCGVDVRNLFKHSILSNAPKIICFHNHPSGTMNASPEDILITERIKSAGDLLGIELVDHIIIGLNGTYISFLESGIRPFGNWQGAA